MLPTFSCFLVVIIADLLSRLIIYIVFIIWKIQKKSYKNTCLQYFICKPSSNCDQTLIIKLAFWFKNFILYLKARKKQTKRDSLNEAFLILNAKRHKKKIFNSKDVKMKNLKYKPTKKIK